MTDYFYTAKSFEGKTESGNANAQDERQLANDLKSRGLLLIKAVAKGGVKKSKFDIKLPFMGASAADRIMITRNLGVMFSAGLPLVKSFEILINQSKNKKFKEAFSAIKDGISKGENLSDSLSKYPSIFSEVYVNMIKVGEESGTLDKIFKVLSLQLQKEHELKSKIQNAMIYPSIIVMVMIVVGIVMVTFVLPSLSVFFKSLNASIPIYTQILLDSGNFLSVHWYLLIIVPLLLVVLFWLTIRTKSGKQLVDTVLLRIPVISPIVKKNSSALFIRSLSSLMSSGVSLIRSLEIVAKTISNNYYKEALDEAGQQIKKGEKLSNSLKAHQNIFPVGVVEMIEVGEETGKTSDILMKLADFYEQEAIDAIDKLTVLIEPVLIVVLGLGVGFFAFSVIQPMYGSLQSIQ